MNGEEANFEEAVRKFQQFLKANQYSPQIEWVQPDDVLLTGKRMFFVRKSSPSARERIARQTYEEGIPRGLGVLLGTICELQTSTCCFVWAPNTPEEAEGCLMPVGLKMSAKTDRIKGIQVRNFIWWAYLRILYSRKQTLKEELFRG